MARKVKSGGSGSRPRSPGAEAGAGGKSSAAAASDLRRAVLIRRVEWAAALLITAWIIVFHVTFLLHAGALWRDEVSSVSVGLMPTWAEMNSELRFDSCPILWPLLVRAWTAVGLGGSDPMLRLLGLLVGLGGLGAVWWHARSTSGGVPLVALTLFSGAPSVVRWGDSMRAYGIGAALMLLAFAMIWRFVERPTWGRAALALVAGVLSIEGPYYNTLMMAAFCAGGAAVALRPWNWRRLLVLAAIGVISAVVFLAFNGAVILSSRDWSVMVKVPTPVTWYFHQFTVAVNAGGDFMIWIWGAAAALVLGICAVRLVKPSPEMTPRDRMLLRFLAVTIVAAVAAYLAFLTALSYPTQSWYYLVIMAVLAVSFDAVIQLAIARSWTARIVRLVVCVGIVLLVSSNLWSQVQIRMTNVDRVAATLETSAQKDDLIIVNPWWPGLTFNRYYHGATPWVTVPEMEDLHVHRLDLLKIKLAAEAPIQSILDRAAETLRAGHRVWVVGGLEPMNPGEPVGTLSPAPNGPWKWLEGPYNSHWSRQITYLIVSLKADVGRVQVPVSDPVNPFEDEPLLVIQGRR
jgi:hypothetical protein